MRPKNRRIKQENVCLLVIDVQLDFCPSGALAVEQGDQVVHPINALMELFDNIVLTQDWHPAGHSSFASSHEGYEPFSSIEMPYGEQILWPDHCIQNSPGAEFHLDLNIGAAQKIIRKGHRHDIDSYSAFFENDGRTKTGLQDWLGAKQINSLYLVGLATDYCVAYSALDAAKLGLDVNVILPACRAIDLEGSLNHQMHKMADAGVSLLEKFPE